MGINGQHGQILNAILNKHFNYLFLKQTFTFNGKHQGMNGGHKQAALAGQARQRTQ
jgi:hypothetical protein